MVSGKGGTTDKMEFKVVDNERSEEYYLSLVYPGSGSSSGGGGGKGGNGKGEGNGKAGDRNNGGDVTYSIRNRIDGKKHYNNR